MERPKKRYEGDIIDGRYRISGVIGGGGLSTVYSAVDLETGIEYALKEYLLSGEAKHDRLIRENVKAEANALEQLRIREIPYIRAFIQLDESSIIVMDRMNGTPLSELLKQEGPMKPELVRRIGVLVCDRLLIKLHENRPPLVYRDLKPANILLDDDGYIRMIDFGTLKEYRYGLEKDRIGLGTPEYASPELLGRIRMQTDARSDIYSLGVTLYTLLTATKRPQDIRKEIFDRIEEAKEEINDPGEIQAEGLLRIIEKCTRQDPKERFQTARELKHALIHSEEISGRYQKKTIVTKALRAAGIVTASCAAAAAVIRFILGGFKMDTVTVILLIVAVVVLIALVAVIILAKTLDPAKKKRSREFAALSREAEKKMLEDEDEFLEGTHLMKNEGKVSAGMLADEDRKTTYLNGDGHRLKKTDKRLTIRKNSADAEEV